MSRADDISRRAARVASHASRPADPAAAEPAPARGRVPRVAPVRITVDLDPAQHRRLKRRCADYADDLERPSVHAADVVRALLDELDADAGLAARVQERLRD